jgi:translation initiation factor 3 subunit L
MPEDSDSFVPQVVTDFLFDLYDSVTTSQIQAEQVKLYGTDLPELSTKYYATTPWPSAASIARECNGDPLFLAIYRELTHRHWHSVSRPTLADRIEGWDVYKELFDEILENQQSNNFYLIPLWVFEILFEFVYQYQGYCQIKSAVYATAKKFGFIDEFGSNLSAMNEMSTIPTKHTNLIENLQLLQSNTEAWDVGVVFSYLHRLMVAGFGSSGAISKNEMKPPVYMYFATFGCICISRLECLLGDYTACLLALDRLYAKSIVVVEKDNESKTVIETVNDVIGARVSLAYHAGISYMQLRRYRDATAILSDCAKLLQRGFKTGTIRSDQYNKQYERILSLLAILLQICPGLVVDDEAVFRAIREKHSSKIETTSNYEEWFQSPKFINANPMLGSMYHKQQVDLFNQQMKPVASGKTLRSFLKLYSSIPVLKLASFHDCTSASDFLPILISYKSRMRQLERDSGNDVKNLSRSLPYSVGTYRSVLDTHYYVVNDSVLVNEAEEKRHLEAYFCAQIAQAGEIRRDLASINTKI